MPRVGKAKQSMSCWKLLAVVEALLLGYVSSGWQRLIIDAPCRGSVSACLAWAILPLNRGASLINGIAYTIYYILYTIYYILYAIYYLLSTIYYILHTTYYLLSIGRGARSANADETPWRMYISGSHSISIVLVFVCVLVSVLVLALVFVLVHHSVV